MKCFRFWKALFEDGVFTNPVIPPAVEPGHSLLRTSYMATHTDAQLDRVLEAFEKVGRKMGVIPETRPRSFVPVKVARPGTFVMSTRPRSVGRPPRPAYCAQRGLSPSHRPAVLARDGPEAVGAVETLTWRAANLQPDDLKRLGAAPFRLWSMRRESPVCSWKRAPICSMKNGQATRRHEAPMASLLHEAEGGERTRRRPEPTSP